MGAILIGIGIAIAVLGVLLGAIGFGSSETTSGVGLLTAGSNVFVGGMLLFALGVIHRALIDLGLKLDGVVHFEPEEDEVAGAASAHGHSAAASGHGHPAAGQAGAGQATAGLAPPPREAEPYAPPFEATEEDLEPPAPVAEPLVPPRAPAPVARSAPSSDSGRGLPSWFRRKNEAEPAAEEPRAPAPGLEPAPLPPLSPPAPREPVAEAPRLEPLRPEPARREPPSFLREGRERPAAGGFSGDDFTPRFGEPRPATATSAAASAAASAPAVSPPPPPTPSAPMSEPRPPRLRDETIPDPGEPPAFLRESDLLGDFGEEEPEEPSITVLKAGTIGGMAYKLYSDGSIEADLPDGTLRFASLQDLREHVAGGAGARAEG